MKVGQFERTSSLSESPFAIQVPALYGQTPNRLLTSHKIEISEEGLNRNGIMQCRICLESEEEGPMIAPCNCEGSIKYTHEKCLIMWITKKIGQTSGLINCELCRRQYEFQKTVSKQFDCFQLFYYWRQEKQQVILALILNCLFLIVTIFLAVIYDLGSSGNYPQIKKIFLSSNLKQTLLVAFMIISSILWVIWVIVCYLMIKVFMLKKIVNIKVKNRKVNTDRRQVIQKVQRKIHIK